jgi:uncharacterized protein (DUF1499 family)
MRSKPATNGSARRRSKPATNGSARAVMVAALLVAGCVAAKTSAFGVVDGKLAPCPSAPHCVSTQAEDRRAIEPAPYSTTRDEARERLVAIIRSMPRATVVTEAPDYVHAEFTSPRFHYVDDVEIYLDDRAKLAQFRSSSRQGYWDFGVNRRRVQAIRERFLAKDEPGTGTERGRREPQRSRRSRQAQDR